MYIYIYIYIYIYPEEVTSQASTCGQLLRMHILSFVVNLQDHCQFDKVPNVYEINLRDAWCISAAMVGTPPKGMYNTKTVLIDIKLQMP